MTYVDFSLQRRNKASKKQQLPNQNIWWKVHLEVIMKCSRWRNAHGFVLFGVGFGEIRVYTKNKYAVLTVRTEAACVRLR